MLVLTRKNNESIMIGSHIKINIIQCEDGKVKLGIEAPKNIKIHREEIFNTIIEENKKANQILPNTLPQLKNL
ncbi:MAG: carbon storage regulator CsrA [Clostridia bacterium]|nr:carbon storage regulator CsrA [Clostridia bacterium]